jgi:hypothetical protein
MLRFICCLLVAISCCTHAQSESIIPWTSDAMSLGRGFDRLTGEARGDCLNISEPSSVSGEKVSFYLWQISREEDLFRSLGISASAKYGLISGGVSSLNEQRINSFSSYMLVSQKVKVRSESVVPGTLKTPDNKTLSANVAKFRKKCGDSFVISRELGGEFTALVELKTRSQQDKAELSAQISGSQGIFSASVEGKQKIEQLTKDRSFRVTIIRNGGEGGLTIDSTQLLQAILDFPDQIKNKPAEKLVSYAATSQDYFAVGVPSNVPSSAFSNLEKIAYLQDLDSAISPVRQHLSDAQYVLDNPDQFEPCDIKALQDSIATAGKVVRDADKKAKECIVADASSCGVLPAVAWTAVGIPKRLEGPTAKQLQAVIDRSRGVFDSTIGSDSWLANHTSMCGQLPNGFHGAACLMEFVKRECVTAGCRP